LREHHGKLCPLEEDLRSEPLLLLPGKRPSAIYGSCRAGMETNHSISRSLVTDFQ
jgi:hypothetical protein